MGKTVAVFAALLALVWPSGAAAAGADGVVARYEFDEGSGNVLRDRSGGGNDGAVSGAEWLKIDGGHALKFDGVDDVVDCGAGQGLDISGDGSIVCWVQLDSHKDQTIVQKGDKGFDKLNNYYLYVYSGTLRAGVGNGEMNANVGMPVGILKLNAWHHVAATWDRSSIRLFVDGVVEARSSALRPKPNKGRLWLGGKTVGGGCFGGRMSRAAIYSRALTPEEVFARYKGRATAMGKDTTLFHRPVVSALAYGDVGKVTVTVDCRAMRPLPQGAEVEIRLGPAGGKAAKSKRVRIPPAAVVQALLDARGLEEGDYEISAAVMTKQKRIGKAAGQAIRWPGKPTWRMPGMKVLNSLVIELLNLPNVAPGKPVEFANPRDGWVFFSATASEKAQGTIRLDGVELPIIVLKGPGAVEAMRHLPKGTHTLAVAGTASIGRVVVRAIPEMLFCKFQYDPHTKPYGPYDWEFLRRHGMLANVNVIIGGDPKAQESRIREWKKTGGRWILERWIGPQTSADECYTSWAETGLTHALVDGVMVDEWGGDAKPMHVEALDRIHKNVPGKAFYAYGGSFYASESGRAFARRIIDCGYKFSREEYLPEQPTERDAWRYLESRLGGEIRGWQRVFPDAQKHIVMCFGILCSPPESLNLNPSVDYKVWQDMQFNYVASSPSFFGLYGLMEYTSGYCDEETLRWIAKLYRHYCIEGNTELLSKRYGFTYELDHVENPDFVEGDKGWTIAACEDGSMGFGHKPGLGWAQGRYPRTRNGDVFLWTRRCSERPNRFSQRIRHLKPGSVYGLKMYAGAHKELDKKQALAVSVRIDGVELIDEKCFQHVYGNYHVEGQWFNFFNYVFRAKGEGAMLTVSDWADGKGPGGPVGQELFFNFVEVQPYLEE